MENINKLPTPRREGHADPIEIARRCERIGKVSGQYAVYLLPPEFDEETYDLDYIPTSDYDDDTEFVPRVLKIPLPVQDMPNVLTAMQIEEDDLESKGYELANGAHRSMLRELYVIANIEELDELFAYPRLADDYGELWRFTFENNQPISGIAYTQDFVTIGADILAELDTETNEEHFQIACRFVDDYVDAQLLLCSYGMFDTTFKLADNCGQNEHCEFRIVDFGELSLNRDDVSTAIREKAWEDIAYKKEQTRLSPSVQRYFNEAFATRFTEEAVAEVWLTSQWGVGRMVPSDKFPMGLLQHFVQENMRTGMSINKTKEQKRQEITARCEKISPDGVEPPVYLLPDEFCRDAWPADRELDAISVRRVAKSIPKVINVHNADIADSIDQLMLMLNRAEPFFVIEAQSSPELARLYGYPLGIRDRFDDCFTYTQDLMTPMKDVIAVLDTENNPEDLRRACQLVDAYIDAQLLLCSYGKFDAGFDMMQSGGYAKDEENFETESDRFRIMSPASIRRDRGQLDEALQTKAWQNAEYADLPPLVRHYVNDAFEARLTSDVIDAVWETKRFSLHLSSASGRCDNDLPLGLAATLWNKKGIWWI